MLSVLLLLSKYRLRNVPVIERGDPNIKNFITQSAVIEGLKGCKGTDWFDCISSQTLSELGLPFMSPDQVSESNLPNYWQTRLLFFYYDKWNVMLAELVLTQLVMVHENELILEAFTKMKDNKIGGVPVVEGPKNKIVGNISIRDIRFLLLKPDMFKRFRYNIGNSLNSSYPVYI